MSTRRIITLTSATLGTAALLLGSTIGGHAQVLGGAIQTPATLAVPPESGGVLSDVLAFTGTANINSDNTNGVIPVAPLNCPVNAVPGQNPEPDGQPFVDLVGCGGTFSFTSAICEGVSDGNIPSAPLPEGPGACTVTANGSFQNLVCGTGTVEGNVAETGGPDSGENGQFGIVFAATVGVVTGNIGNDDGSGGAPFDYVVGVVDLGPSPTATVPGDDAFDCTNQFTVTSVDLLFDL